MPLNGDRPLGRAVTAPPGEWALATLAGDTVWLSNHVSDEDGPIVWKCPWREPCERGDPGLQRRDGEVALLGGNLIEIGLWQDSTAGFPSTSRSSGASTPVRSCSRRASAFSSLCRFPARLCVGCDHRVHPRFDDERLGVRDEVGGLGPRGPADPPRVARRRKPAHRCRRTGRDGTARRRLWPAPVRRLETKNWTQVPSPLDDQPIGLASYSSDGALLATIDPTGTITIRDGHTFEPLGAPMTSERGVTGGAVFSSDGRYLVTSTQGFGTVWDLATRQPVGAAFPNDPDAVSIATGPDALLITGVGNRLLVWNVDPDSWAEVACQAAGRNLTHEEWAQYIGTAVPYERTCPQWLDGE